MMETQDILNTETGTQEAVTLKPMNVKIVKIDISKVDVKGKEKEKAIFIVKHPDREDNVEISKVKYEKDGKLKVSGLWVSLDSENKLQKGSALARLKDFHNVRVLNELIGKEIITTEDEQGYLCFKAY